MGSPQKDIPKTRSEPKSLPNRKPRSDVRRQIDAGGRLV